MILLPGSGELMVEDGFQVVGEVADGDQAVVAATQVRPDGAPRRDDSRRTTPLATYGRREK
jgi:hypothetical protein